MVVSPSSILDSLVFQICHVKIQALITYHLISKRWEGVYLVHLKYNLPQDEGDESYPITFRKYLANMTAKTGNYSGDQLFHTISCDNNPTTLSFMFPLIKGVSKLVSQRTNIHYL